MLDDVLHPEARNETHRFVDHRGKLGEVVAECSRLLLGAALAETDMQPAPRQDIERGAALGHLHRMVHLRRQADDAVADPDARRRAGDERQEHLRGAHVGVVRQRGVLDRPDDVEADGLGQQRLLDDLGEDLSIAGAAGVGGLRFVDE
jgi:hypothetical protein